VTASTNRLTADLENALVAGQLKGGPGSGFFAPAHQGIPGKQGGSQSGGGGAGTQGVLDSRKSGIYRGFVYRAVDSTSKVRAALGTGRYFTPSPDAAKKYGSDVRRFYVGLDRVLGTNSPEYNALSGIARAKWTGSRSLIEEIRQLAEARGWQAIYGGTVFGLNVFNAELAAEA
jgi:hypothetical protein